MSWTLNVYRRCTCRLLFKSGNCNKGKEQRRNLPNAAGSFQQMANAVSAGAARVLDLAVEPSVYAD